MSTPQKQRVSAQQSSSSSASSSASKRRSKVENSSKNPQELHFASSSFLSAPHPSKLPIPDFDEEENEAVPLQRIEANNILEVTRHSGSDEEKSLIVQSSEEPFSLPSEDWAKATNQIEELPHLDSLPRCPLDDQYCFSFACSDCGNQIDSSGILNFFNEYGFVVIRNVFSSDDCQRSRDAMWEILEELNPSLQRNDPKTWSQLKSNGRYGLSIRGPSFHRQFVQNRQNPVLAKVLSIVTEAGRIENLMVSQDRFTVYRATRYDDPTIPGSSFSTGEKNLHLDLNPWWWEENAKEILDGLDKSLSYEEDEQDFIKENNLIVSSMGRHVQCVINFVDNQVEDGGTLIVPYFHRYLHRWNEIHRSALKKPLPWVTLPGQIDRQYLAYAHRIPMREGSVLLWDQRVLHGTSPNQSYRCRMAQYLKAFPRNLVFPSSDTKEMIPHPRLLKRSQAIYNQLEKRDLLSLISPTGRYLFGLDLLMKEEKAIDSEEIMEPVKTSLPLAQSNMSMKLKSLLSVSPLLPPP